jgi:hypothetical protein
MTFAKVANIAVLAALAGFGAGLLWGVADRRKAENIVAFADQHILVDEPAAMLVFSCANLKDVEQERTKEREVGYNLLIDKVIKDPKEIHAKLSAPFNQILQQDLFLHATTFAAGGAGLGYSIKDNIRIWGERKAQRFSMVVVALASTAYIGYLASSAFGLECGSKIIYDKLASPTFWAPFRLTAAKILFDKMAFCVDRNATLRTPPRGLANSTIPLTNTDQSDKSADWDQKLDQWRKYSAVANSNLPQQSDIEHRFRRVGASPLAEADGTNSNAKPTWGDSIYQRIYGYEGFVEVDTDFDKSDFLALYEARRRCDEQLDKEKAVDLYSQACRLH